MLTAWSQVRVLYLSLQKQFFRPRPEGGGDRREGGFRPRPEGGIFFPRNGISLKKKSLIKNSFYFNI